MLIDTSTREMTLSAARLLIHAEDKRHSRSQLAATWQWLRAHCSNDYKNERGPLRLQIADLQGNVMMTSDDAGALVDVSLPAGTYQVKAQYGQTRRDYTFTLTQGRSFDLYLQLAPDKS